MGEHKIQFGILHPDGKLTNIGYIKQSDIGKCPHVIMISEHYREDGSCKCNDPDHRKMMIKKWGYSKKSFVGIPLLKKGNE